MEKRRRATEEMSVLACVGLGFDLRRRRHVGAGGIPRFCTMCTSAIMTRGSLAGAEELRAAGDGPAADADDAPHQGDRTRQGGAGQ